MLPLVIEDQLGAYYITNREEGEEHSVLYHNCDVCDLDRGLFFFFEEKEEGKISIIINKTLPVPLFY